MKRSMLLSSAAMLAVLVMTGGAFAQPPEEGMAPTQPRQSVNQRPAGGNYDKVPSGPETGSPGGINQRPPGSSASTAPARPPQPGYDDIPNGPQNRPGGSTYDTVPPLPTQPGPAGAGQRATAPRQQGYDDIPNSPNSPGRVGSAPGQYQNLPLAPGSSPTGFSGSPPPGYTAARSQPATPPGQPGAASSQYQDVSVVPGAMSPTGLRPSLNRQQAVTKGLNELANPDQSQPSQYKQLQVSPNAVSPTGLSTYQPGPSPNANVKPSVVPQGTTAATVPASSTAATAAAPPNAVVNQRSSTNQLPATGQYNNVQTRSQYEPADSKLQQ